MINELLSSQESVFVIDVVQLKINLQRGVSLSYLRQTERRIYHLMVKSNFQKTKPILQDEKNLDY